MTIKNNDITTVKEEAEERNGGEAEVVEATDFQSVTREFKSPHRYKLNMDNWHKENKKNDVRNDITIGFNCVATTDIIGGRNFSRMSVLQR